MESISLRNFLIIRIIILHFLKKYKIILNDFSIFFKKIGIYFPNHSPFKKRILKTPAIGTSNPLPTILELSNRSTPQDTMRQTTS